MRRRTWVLAGAAVCVAAAVTGGAVALSGAEPATATAQGPPAHTVEVQQGPLSSMVLLDGTLTHRARADGSPYSAINQAHGTYTRLPEVGDEVDCGDVLYRVDDEPVLLLCGTVPAYRALDVGDEGEDVRQLNRNLHVRSAGDAFTTKTEQALAALQRRTGADASGSLALGGAVFLPRAVRIAEVTGRLGGSARPGAQALHATSGTLHVQVNLDRSEQGQVRRGNRARITLPGNRSVTGTVDRLGSVAMAPAGRNADPAAATIPASIRLDEPRKARGLDRAPVRVEITTQGVERARSVPVTALVGRSGGGFAVEAVRGGGRRELVAVELGLFDTANGRVEVEGALAVGDRVVVPSP